MPEIDPEYLKHQYLYVPYEDKIDTVAIGKAIGLYVAGQLGVRLTILTVMKSNASMHREFNGLTVVTERSGSISEGSVVLAWCPTDKAMDKLSHLSKSIAVAVEWPTTSLRGWAKLVGAYNIFTGTTMESGLSPAGLATMDDIVSEGYNGWHDDIARTLVHGHLRELSDRGEYDRELVLAHARRAKGEYSMGTLVKILDRFEMERQSV